MRFGRSWWAKWKGGLHDVLMGGKEGKEEEKEKEKKEGCACDRFNRAIRRIYIYI